MNPQCKMKYKQGNEKENHQHAPCCALDLMHPLWSWRLQALLLRRLLLGLCVLALDTTLITTVLPLLGRQIITNEHIPEVKYYKKIKAT